MYINAVLGAGPFLTLVGLIMLLTGVGMALQPGVRRLAERFDWDLAGVCLAFVLFIGELIAAGLAVAAIVLADTVLGAISALFASGSVLIYVPFAVRFGTLPFASFTEFERRRKYAQKVLGVRIPRSHERTFDNGTRIPAHQVNFRDTSENSILEAVGYAYSLGGDNLNNILRYAREGWNGDLADIAIQATFKLNPPTMYMSGVATVPHEFWKEGYEGFSREVVTVS